MNARVMIPRSAEAQAPVAAQHGRHALGGLLLLSLVCVMLALPLALAIRGAVRRRSRARLGRPDGAARPMDAWTESARRMETPR